MKLRFLNKYVFQRKGKGKIKMIKTRRFKALNGCKGEYLKIVDKIAVYENDELIDCCVIQTDNNGREYYYPSNKNDEFGLFSDKPKDAMECIKAGFGDAIERSRTFGMTTNEVVRYIDRDYGEDIRLKTLDGWKFAKFSYAVKFSYKSAFDDGRFVMKDKSLMSFNNSMRDILTFDTQDDAEKFIKDAMDKVAEYRKEYSVLCKSDDDEILLDARKQFISNLVKSFESGYNSVYLKLFTGLVGLKDSSEPLCGLSVVQIVLNN